MESIGVECRFAVDGGVQVQRILLDDRWLVVEQGRQWLDEQGRHVLVLVQGSRPREIILLRESLRWVTRPGGAPGVYVA
jgi:hypothetical protein